MWREIESFQVKPACRRIALVANGPAARPRHEKTEHVLLIRTRRFSNLFVFIALSGL